MALASLEMQTGILPQKAGLPKGLMGLVRHTQRGERPGYGNVWFLALWEDHSPAVCTPEETD